MIDTYARRIDYLRVSVTNRCNLRCKYCMPEEGVEDIGHANMLTLEEIAHLVNVSASIGIQSVRLTGGEPLLRKNITKLIADIAGIPGIDDISMTTNGMLFTDMASDLKQAGLNRVNFSLDTLDAERFRHITGCGDLRKVCQAISTALEIGMNPIKINTVVMQGINDQEILDIAELAKTMPIHVRFIEFMPIGDLPFYQQDRFIPMHTIREIVEAKYELTDSADIKGSGPAKSFKIRNGLGTIGFISAMSHSFCHACHRMRLTADGKLRGCLFAKQEINIKLALKNHASDETIADIFRRAIREKPEQHCMNAGWGADNTRKMYQIGG